MSGAPVAVTVIPGDGIGPEVVEAARYVLEAAGVPFAWETVPAGATAIDAVGEPLPPATVDSIRRTGLALKGPVTTPVGRGFRSVNVGLRLALDLFAGVRPVRSLPGVNSRYEGVDLVIVRENTEDLYVGNERQLPDGSAEAVKLITPGASERIVDYAFQLARREGRRKVTAGHKANILKLTDGLFLEVARTVAARYPDIEFEDSIIDALCLRLVQRPEDYNVIVLPNLYGDILSDLAAGLVGGLGVVPGANFGRAAVFEAVHGSAPDIAGRGVANPVAMMLSGAMLLRHIGETTAAGRLETAIRRVLAGGRVRTPDLGGTAGTWQVAEAVAREVSA